MSRGFLPLLGIVLALGTGALAWATEGFRVVTSEGARQLAVERKPVPVPDVKLVDQDGHAFSLRDYRGKTVLVEFIYTRCPTLCGVLGDDFGRALALLRARGSGRKIDLLSISFDPVNDDQSALRRYGDRFGATAPRWRVAVPVDGRGLAVLLHAFGVAVVPDGIGGFVHDGSVYLVDPRERLVRILGPTASPGLVAQAARASRP